LQLILSEKVSVDYQVYTLSQFSVIMQYVMYIVAIMCVVLYVYVAEWKHIIRLRLAVTVTGVGDVYNVHDMSVYILTLLNTTQVS
jgi:amino acid transporter